MAKSLTEVAKEAAAVIKIMTPYPGQMRDAVRAAVAVVAALSCLTAGGPALAEGHLLQEPFTFKRIGAPPAGSAPRITVQVAPSGPSGPSAPSAAGTPRSTASSRVAPSSTPTPPREAAYKWFWAEVSPELTASGPGRLDEGLRALRAAPGGATVRAPRLETLHKIAESHGPDILRATIGKEISPALVAAVIAVESAGQEDAVSRAGAQGLMQLMPATAARFDVEDSFDGAQNIAGGTTYLSWLLEEFGGDPILALAAYNAGEGAVRRSAGVPNYAETRDYVPKVLAAWTVARGLCVTPPVLVSDGCVFVVEAKTDG